MFLGETGEGLGAVSFFFFFFYVDSWHEVFMALCCAAACVSAYVYNCLAFLRAIARKSCVYFCFFYKERHDDIGHVCDTARMRSRAKETRTRALNEERRKK